MTFWTLNCNGTEKTFADWKISTARRAVNNQAGDNLAFDLLTAVDTSPDPFPYGAKITVYRNRGSATPPGPGGLPPVGATGFSGGTIFFVGYRVDNFRSGTPQLEKFNYKFAGPWEFFFERLVFQKLWFTWNGSELVADWRSAVTLGMSVYALVGAGDGVPGSVATNLMSIRQQVIEIVQYVIAQTALLTAYGSTAQLQFDSNSHDSGGNYNLNANTAAELAAAGAACLIPDFMPGYEAAGQTSVSVIGTIGGGILSGLPTSSALRAPLDTVNEITCAEAVRYMLKWTAFIGSTVTRFDYTTNPPTFRVATRDQLTAVNLPFPPVP